MTGDVVFVGDAHLHDEGEGTRAFLRMLERVAPTASTVVLAGDLFDLWIGAREMERPHHRRVVAALASLRARGTRVRYLEGNRDYRIGPAYAGSALDDASGDGIVEEVGGRRLFAIHGDRANADDRVYRGWRALSRSRAVWSTFSLLPARVRVRVSDGLERRMRGTNLRYKRSFPDEAVRRYAAGFLARGFDAVVLGHFHVEKDLVAEPPSAPGRILVLPEWTGSRRHLRAGRDGRIAFEDSP